MPLPAVPAAVTAPDLGLVAPALRAPFTSTDAAPGPLDLGLASNLGLASVVVTGAAGFIGGHLVRALCAAGSHVTALDARSVADDVAGRVRCRHGDLLAMDLQEAFRGADVVFHLAGRPGVRQSWGSGFADYVSSNVLGTERVVRACEAAGVGRLVVASSSSVYGPGNGWPSRESDPVRPISPYGVSKLAAEQVCLTHALRGGASTTVVALRYFTVYGPGQRGDMLTSRLLQAVRTGHPTPIFGDGRQVRDFTFVDDVVAATAAAATIAARAEVINVAGGSPVPIAEVLRIVSEVTGSKVPISRAPAADGDVPATHADLTQARALLGYAPRVGLEEGISRQAACDTRHAVDSCTNLSKEH